MKRTLVDQFGRTHNYLRLSLTDKCNLHCTYCNPIMEQYVSAPTKEMMSCKEIERLVTLFVKTLQVDKVRLTGGEPTVRKDFYEILESLSAIKKTHPFALGITTNGTRLNNALHTLHRFGVESLNISLDSLHDEKFTRITQGNNFADVYRAILNAKESGLFDVKVNVVVMRGINDDEILQFTRFALEYDLNVRFIEFMPFKNNGWNNDYFISYHEMIKTIQTKYCLVPLDAQMHAVSKDYAIQGERGTISFITSVSEHFCGGCNRLRVTANGKLKACLFSTPEQELSLLELLRNPLISDDMIATSMEKTLQKKWYQHPEIEELHQLSSSTMVGIGG